MFAGMIRDLQEGRLPASGELRSRLAAAVVKKMGVLRQPPACWSGDTKINPPSAHMLWAALLLEDAEQLQIVWGLLLEEQASRAASLPVKTAQLLFAEQAEAFLAVAGGEDGGGVCEILEARVATGRIILGLDRQHESSL